MSCPAPELFPTAPGDDAAGIAGEIAALRTGLLAYVASLLPQARGEAEDVVQATCVVLWEKRHDFQQGTDFRAWAFRTAYFQAMAMRRDLSRSKVAVFSDETLQRLAAPAEEAASGIDSRVTALRFCVAELPPADQRLLALKYLRGESLTDHARELGVPSGRVQKSLSRLRLALKHCIEKRLKLS